METAGSRNPKEPHPHKQEKKWPKPLLFSYALEAATVAYFSMLSSQQS